MPPALAAADIFMQITVVLPAPAATGILYAKYSGSACSFGSCFLLARGLSIPLPPFFPPSYRSRGMTTRNNDDAAAKQYAGCDSAPLYGVKGGPQSFCREHKRAGMFTSRNGELLVATRDGSGKGVQS